MGGVSIVPDEKLKASQANLSPFVVGDGEIYNESKGVWIYEGLREIDDSVDTIGKLTILGRKSVYNATNNLGTLISSGDLNFISKDPEKYASYDGAIIAGAHVWMMSLKPSTFEQTWDFVQRGSLVTGMNLRFTNRKMLEALTDGIAQNCLYDHNTKNIKLTEKYPFNQGVITAGRGCFFTGRNAGVIICSDLSTINGYNNGVVICGDNQADETDILFEKYDNTTFRSIKTDIGGPGIVIVGSKYSTKQNTWSNGYIQVSTTNLKTLFKGNLQLDETCNIYDKDGTQLVTNGKLTNVAKTIAQLEERIAQLEAKQAST